MQTYAIEFKRSAIKDLTKFQKNVQIQITKAIVELSKNPRGGNAKKLTGADSWRVRTGDYRIIYDINDNKLVILVIKVAHRKDIYR